MCSCKQLQKEANKREIRCAASTPFVGTVVIEELRNLLVSCVSFLRQDLQVGDDAVAIAPKADGAAGAVAEFVHHQRWLRSAVDEDFYLPPSSLFRHSHRSASIGSIVPLISWRMANLRSFIDNS